MRHNKRGFTMIELTVSLALGVVVSLAATQLFLTNQVNLNYQRAMSDVQVSGRYAMDLMASEIRMAGLQNEALDQYAGLPFSTAELGSSQVNVANLAPYFMPSPAKPLTAHDRLVVQRFSVGAGVDCEGNSYAAGDYVVSRYFLRPENPASDVVVLACDAGRGSGSAATAPTGYGDNGAVLMTGVESFGVEYGIRDAGGGIRYVGAGSVGANKVVAVRLGLYARSEERAGEPILPATDVRVLSRVISNTNSAFQDGRIRRLFVSTTEVRN